ncbi:MAG: hypothetical protein EKK34_00385 [Mycobacterium sp.]|nr:MAG: hypothetical protein EKK34_00385 [Mycobacterium sp.]
MGIFGRITARQRLRRATQESLSVPTFSAPLDCTPWVIGGLWPEELSAGNSETAILAGYLKTDLQRIASAANDDLRAIGRAGMDYAARRDAEARVIDEARDLAVRRVESTMRQLRQLRQDPEPARDMDKTQVLPAIRDEPPPQREDGKYPPGSMDTTQVLPAIRDDPPAPPPPSRDGQHPAEPPESPAETDDDRLQHLLAFVARQEPRLSWAVGERPDGTTVLVTDLAHGWIPPGIALPEGVHLLEPQRRSGRAADFLGPTTRVVTYTPGDPARWSSGAPDPQPSVQPFALPALEDLDWELRVATHWREGLPRLVNTMAKAVASGADIAEQEVDLLRVHLDTVRYQVLAQYPDADPAQLLNCMLLAAVDGRVSGDPVSANYHLAWFVKLDSAPAGNRGENRPETTD